MFQERYFPNVFVSLVNSNLPFSHTQKTALSVNQWATYHNPKNFKRPNEFIPERWISSEFATDNKAAFQPFSFGPRNCLGKKYVLSLLTACVSYTADNQTA